MGRGAIRKNGNTKIGIAITYLPTDIGNITHSYNRSSAVSYTHLTLPTICSV